MTKTYKVKDVIGLHARPASVLVQVAGKFANNEIFIVYKDKRLTLKSIIAVMSLGVAYDHEFAIDVEGENPEAVYTALEQVMTEHDVVY